MTRQVVIGLAGALIMVLGYQNCSPFEALHIKYQGSSLRVDDPTKDDAVMNEIAPSLFSVALQYFPKQAHQLPAKRLFRLTQRQIDLSTKSLLPNHYISSVTIVMPKDPLQTNYEFAEIINFNGANITPYNQWVSAIAERVLESPNSLFDCEAQQNSESCLSQKAQKLINRAFRNTAPRAIEESYLSFFLQIQSRSGHAQAKSDLVNVLLNSPYYLFRVELSTDENNFLADSELTQNLSYTLTDAPPELILGKEFDSSLFKDDQAKVQELVQRSLASTYAKEKLVRFFKSWLEIKEAEELKGFEATLPGFDANLAQSMVGETDKFLRYQIGKMAPKLKDITQSSESFIDQTLNQIYANPEVSDEGLVATNSKERMGVFTQSSFIASHSGPEDTRLVKRGVFFTRKVMCLEIGSVPGNVETELPPDDGMLTERQRIEAATNSGRCIGCHTYINPFGFMQEHYDPLGRWRERDHHELPIDTHITVNFLDQGRSYRGSNPVESLKYFTDSMQFKQCFVRQLFRYYTGRRETESDHPLLRKMFFNFAYNDNQDILRLLETLAISSRLSQRAEGGQ